MARVFGREGPSLTRGRPLAHGDATVGNVSSTAMPFGNSLPLVLVLAAIAALAAFVADRMAETGREYLRALFPRLALAAKRQDIDTILAVLEPDLHPLRG